MDNNQIIIKVEGMTCSNCARSVETAVADKGGEDISVNLADKEVVFNNPQGIPAEDIAEAIEKRGYKVIREAEKDTESKKKS